MIAGYYGGITDTFVSRLIDIVLSMPVLLLAIGLAASVCSICRPTAAWAASSSPA